MTTASIPQSQKEIRLLLLWGVVPLLGSFFIEKIDTPKNKSYTEYNKKNTYWQVKVLEEVAGKADAEDIFAQIVNSFGGEIPSTFFRPHEQTLSLK